MLDENVLFYVNNLDEKIEVDKKTGSDVDD